MPWLIAAGILAFLITRLPRRQLLDALGAGPSWGIGLYSAALMAATLLADALATRIAFAATGVVCPWSEVLLARGATYLLGVLNAAVGQGGMGLYLHRAGVGPLRATGTIVFLLATQLGALALVATAGALAAGGSGLPGVPAMVSLPAGGGFSLPAGGAAGPAAALGPAPGHWLPWLGLLAAGLCAYLALVRWRPRALARREVLAPLFAAGAGGFLRAIAARAPHVLLLLVGLWGGLRMWGVELPLGQGLVLLAAVLLVMLLPIAPAGIGTQELALVTWISPFAPHAEAAARQASVLAFSLVFHLFGLVAQAALGLLCLGVLQRRKATGGAAALSVEP
ncbi:MAG TPA: hypothetical protein VHR45_03105 [Thermoanaerobaculia bacterium]|nr:hypothetical protein [Thermoanaerobaculia bacterium]